MVGIEKSHGDSAIDAILMAYNQLLAATVQEALREVSSYGKSDTLGLDAMPEIAIVNQLEAYDNHAVVITEERGADPRFNIFAREADPRTAPTFYISDPTDRSAQLTALLMEVDDNSRYVADVFNDEGTRRLWEQKYGSPVEITGPSSAITCVRRGLPVFSVILNYMTQQLYVSCSAGNYVITLSHPAPPMDLNHIISNGSTISFPGIDHGTRDEMRRFVTYVGDKTGYKQNFIDSSLMNESDMARCLHYALPGGPLRILYLSSVQPEQQRVGFILANGEKIIEWIHWLPFIRFARMEDDQGEQALLLFEIYEDRPWTKEGILMATPPAYSVFKALSGRDSLMAIDVRRFADFANPSKIRCTLLVAPRGNHWAIREVNQYGYRLIELYED